MDGVFDGKIHSKDGVYYVEKASKYFPRSENSSSSGSANEGDRFHSIIYKEAHVVDPYDQHRTGTKERKRKKKLAKEGSTWLIESRLC